MVMPNSAKDPASGMNAAVAAELRAEKAALGLTNQDLADRSGIPVVSVQRYLAPSRNIDIEILGALCDALGVSLTEIARAAEARLSRPTTEAERDAAAAVDRIDQHIREGRPRT